MSNTHRLLWIDAQIRAGQYPNAATAAKHFEISHRQALRDIEYMRDTLGAPLEYCYVKKGYHYLKPSFALPAAYLTPEQKATLGSLSALYNLIPEEHARQMATLFQRLTPESGIAQREPDELAPSTYSILVKFAAPALIDFSFMASELKGEGLYRITAHDQRQLLLFLLQCPCRFEILEPSYLKLHFRAMLEKTLRSLQ